MKNFEVQENRHFHFLLQLVEHQCFQPAKKQQFLSYVSKIKNKDQFLFMSYMHQAPHIPGRYAGCTKNVMTIA